MSKFITGLLGATALLVSLGAAQFAVGHDLAGFSVDVAAASQSDHVNRLTKTDRPAGISPVSGSTIVTQLNAFDDTSIAIRVSRPQREGKVIGKGSRRPVACEAAASVLTDIAKQMESGRCVT